MLLAYARYASECYDAPVNAPDARVVLAWFVAVVVAWVVLPRVPWVRIYRALDAVEVPLPRLLVAGWGRLVRAVRALSAALAAVVGSVRAVLDPAAEERRRLGRFMAALPPRSGLTRREELLEECAALPPGRARAVLRAQILAYVPERPSTVLKARLNAGSPAVAPGIVRALLRGEVPYCLRKSL